MSSYAPSYDGYRFPPEIVSHAVRVVDLVGTLDTRARDREWISS